MVSLKERTVKGRTYIYLSTTASYKGHKKWFEKMIGPKGMKKARMKRRIEFHTEILKAKKDVYEFILKVKHTELKHIPQGYGFYLTLISQYYEQYLSSMYPSELDKYIQEFEVRYVSSTTALEGNTLSLRETGLVLTEGLSPRNKKLREIHEVENYEKVLLCVKSRKKDIDRGFILELHQLIQRNIDDDSAGSFRRGNVKIIGSKWEPPQGVVVEDEIKILLDWYNVNKKTLHPVELAGLFHHKFLQVHPFADGNGRVGRELLNFIFKRNNYPMLIIPVEQRQEYLESLEEADNGKPGHLLEFFIKILIKDYFTVVFNTFQMFQAKIGADLGELDKSEIEEIKNFLIWFIEETKELLINQKKIEPDLKDLLGQLIKPEDSS